MKEIIFCTVIAITISALAGLLSYSCIFVRIVEEKPDPFCVLPLPESSDPLLATKCLTCGIHFTHPSYGEHIKTCCP